MPTRVVMFCVAACLAATAAAAQKPPANEDCLACHGDSSLKRDDGRALAFDPAHLQGSTHGPMACVDCHADLATLADFPHKPTLARVQCAGCHDAVGGKYHDSIHAWAKEKAGLVAAPTCASCHGTHDVKAHTDKASRVYRDRVPATCGSCHAGVLAQFDNGVHAAALKKGDTRAPVCIDCHATHAIARTDTDRWRLGVTAECGSCHAKVADAFRLTFHGKVNALGSTRVAACASCHGAHEILPASNPASMVAPSQLMTTCGRCHEGANANFVRYDPHPDPRNHQRSASLWWANRFYWVLIPGCFGFFGLHSLLWFRRSLKEQRR